MKVFTNSSLIIAISLGIPSAIAQSGPAAGPPAATQIVAVENGTVSFSVPTNMPAIEVSGKSTALQARVQMHRDANGVTLERIEAWLPVKTLDTGMRLRDDHMRKRIFATTGGDIPDLRFEGGNLDCPWVAPGHEAACAITGTLAIRGIARGLSISVRVRQDARGDTFRATVDGIVRLSDYGIEQPTQLGVKTANEVKIHLDLSGKEIAPLTTAMGKP